MLGLFKQKNISGVSEWMCSLSPSLQSFLDIVTELEKKGQVSSESMDLIEQCLTRIHRIDLVKKIKQYKRKGDCLKTHFYSYRDCLTKHESPPCDYDDWE